MPDTATPDPVTAARPWLDELIARLGEPRVHAGPTNPGRMSDADGAYRRECWVWFPPPDLRNHNLALDRYEGHWMIRANGFGACGHAAQAKVRHPGSDEPPAGIVRAALVTAGMLPSRHEAAADHALALCSLWETAAARAEARAAERAAPASTGLSYRAQALSDCARELREAITAAVTGEEKPGG